MSSATFDTLAYAKKLIAVGFTQQQAEVQAETMREIIEENLATKRDIKDLELKLEQKIKEMEMRLTIKMGAMIAASIAIIVTLMKLL